MISSKQRNEKRIFLLKLILFFALSFNVFLSLSSQVPKHQKVKSPPGTQKLADNFFYDQTDLCNLYWREYMYWVIRVFGKNSPEYMAAVPDTSLLSEKNPCLKSSISEYLWQPWFNHWPATGISFRQAEDFAKWRSDRVMEQKLIRDGKIEINSEVDSLNYFTIEKYFSGNYQNTHPDTTKEVYPEYRLPDANDLVLILNYSSGRVSNKPVKKKDTVKKITSRTFKKKNTIGNSGFYTAALKCANAKNDLAGGRLTGFRYVCQWKKWGE